MATFATSDGTRKYAARFAGRAAAGHFREQQGLWLSSLGIGTYLGEADEGTDRGYTGCDCGRGRSRRERDRFGDQLPVPRTIESSTSSTFLPWNSIAIAFSFWRTLFLRSSWPGMMNVRPM